MVRLTLGLRDAKLKEALISYLRIMTRLEAWSLGGKGEEYLQKIHQLIEKEVGGEDRLSGPLGASRAFEARVQAALLGLAADIAFQKLRTTSAPREEPLDGMCWPPYCKECR